MSLRLIGKNDYKQVITSLRDAGEIATLDDYISSLPAVNESVQDQWKQTLDRMLDQEMYNRVTDEQWFEYFLHGKSIPQDALDEHELARPVAEELIRILLEEKPIVSTAGYLASCLPMDKRNRPESYHKLNIPNLLNSRSFATWLRCELFLNPHNTKALNAFDAYVHSFVSCGTLIDAMIAIAIQRIRDETYLTLAYYRRLPSAVFEPWCNETPNGLLLVSDAFVGERVIFIDGLMMSLGQQLQHVNYYFGGSPLSTWESIMEPFYGVYFWSTIHHDAALITHSHQCISTRLRGIKSVTIPPYDKDQFWGISGALMMPNLIESGITALEHGANQRLCRLATRIMNDVKAPLPADTELLCRQFPYAKNYVHPTGDTFLLLYERLSDTRFRLLIDPASPPIDFDDTSRMRSRCNQLGKPAARERIITKNLTLELDLAGRPESKP